MTYTQRSNVRACVATVTRVHYEYAFANLRVSVLKKKQVYSWATYIYWADQEMSCFYGLRG